MQLRGITMKRIVAAYIIYTYMTQATGPCSKYRLILALMMTTYPDMRPGSSHQCNTLLSHEFVYIHICVYAKLCIHS